MTERSTTLQKLFWFDLVLLQPLQIMEVITFTNYVKGKKEGEGKTLGLITGANETKD